MRNSSASPIRCRCCTEEVRKNPSLFSLFVLHFVSFRYSDRLPRAKGGPFDVSVAFQLFLRCDAKAGPGNGFQTPRLDRFAGQFTRAVSSIANTIQRLLNFIKRALF